MSQPLALIILDGFGLRSDPAWNAIAAAKTPTFDRLFAHAPWTSLEAAGLAVGLPDGQMGNSEVGHLNIGAGRVVDQDLIRISKAVERKELDAIPAFRDAVAAALERGTALHIAGLLSDGGVHAHQAHLHGLIEAAARLGAPRIFVHAILDGRDTAPRSAERFLRELMDFLSGIPSARLATLVGRYFTMDRDARWDRVQRGYDLMTLGTGARFDDPLEALADSYARGIADEFVEPVTLMHAPVADGDVLLFANFRADRMRQIVTAFADNGFDGFARAACPAVDLVTMNRYREDWTFPVLFPPAAVRNHLGAVLAADGRTQLRIAETEKFAHVTFFFDGGSDEQFPGEERVLVPSQKVATYDLAPAMSAPALAERAAAEIASGRHAVVILNIANPDMVGHTGVMDAAVEAVEATDAAVATVLAAVEAAGGVALITADHGNCEVMFDAVTGQPSTSHTSNPVPLILIDPARRWTLMDGGVLADVAPTALALLGIEQPPEMTGRSLLDGGNCTL